MQNSVDAQEPRGPTDTDDNQEARFSWSGTGPYSLRTKYTPYTRNPDMVYEPYTLLGFMSILRLTSVGFGGMSKSEYKNASV